MIQSNIPSSDIDPGLLPMMLSKTLNPTMFSKRFYSLLVVFHSVLSVLAFPGNTQAARRDLVLPTIPDDMHNTTSMLNIYPRCFQQTRDPRQTPKLLPAKVVDCFFILYHVLSQPHATVVMPWDNVAPQGPTYVRRWSFESCTIAFQAVIPHSQDAFPEMLVARQAALVIKACLIPATDFLGGHMPVGSESAYSVIVGGDVV